MTIRRKKALGACRLFLQKSGGQIASFVAFAVVVRLIGPEQYGLAALGGVLTALAAIVIDGMAAGVAGMQDKDGKLSALFWIVTGCGVMAGLLIFAAAGPLATLMRQDELTPLLRSFAGVPVMIALGAVPSAWAIASMDRQAFAARAALAASLAGVAGIVLAWTGYGAFALAGQQIVFYLVRAVAMWAGAGWQPRLVFGKDVRAKILLPGLRQAGSALPAFLERQAPRLLLGFVIGPVAVGYYTFALRLGTAIKAAAIRPVLALAQPAFADTRGSRAEKSRVFAQAMQTFCVVLFGVLTMAAVAAPVYVPMIFGWEWAPMAPLVRLACALSAAGALRDLLCTHKTAGVDVRTQIIVVLAGLTGLTALAFWGLAPFMGGQIAIFAVAFVIYATLVAQRSGIRVWRALARLWACAAAAGIMGIALFAFTLHARVLMPPLPLLMADLALGTALYISLYGLLQLQQLRPLINFVRRMRMARKDMPPAMPASEI